MRVFVLYGKKESVCVCVAVEGGRGREGECVYVFKEERVCLCV